MRLQVSRTAAGCEPLTVGVLSCGGCGTTWSHVVPLGTRRRDTPGRVSGCELTHVSEAAGMMHYCHASAQLTEGH